MGATEPHSVTLRGATIVAAPFGLLGILAAAVAVASALWIASDSAHAGIAAWLCVAIAAVVAVLGFAAAKGCRVVVSDGWVNDLVAWRTVHRIRCASITAVRVRSGAWRTFEMELDDGSHQVVLGAGPTQFPAHLLGDARDRDLRAIDTMLGVAMSAGST